LVSVSLTSLATAVAALPLVSHLILPSSSAISYIFLIRFP
jgi:hypothetical protein